MRTAHAFLWLVAVDLIMTASILAAPYGGGSGTSEDPFQIWTADQLELLGQTPADYDKHFILMADIDLSGRAYTSPVIAKSWNIMDQYINGTSYRGVFDGDDHSIMNLTIHTVAYDRYIGLFGGIGEGSQIRNLRLHNVNIDGAFPRPRYVGGICGSNDGGIINNCRMTGKVSGEAMVGGICGMNLGIIQNSVAEVDPLSGNDVGGICGSNEYGALIENCQSSGRISGSYPAGGLCGTNIGTIIKSGANVILDGVDAVGGLCGFNRGMILESYASGDLSGNQRLGGFCGINDGKITDCYARGNVKGLSRVGGIGGLCGTNTGTIGNCYSMGSATSLPQTPNIGGFCGESIGMVTNSFWDMDTSGMSSSAGGTGKTSAQMKTLSTFTDAGWDFATVWMICDGKDYPHLLWEGLQCLRYSGGSGTAEDPYQIATPVDLIALGNTPSDNDKHFILTADIDLAGRTITEAVIAPDISTADQFQGTPFTGTFDGNGHVIRNLAIDQPSKDHVGLFGRVTANGQIRNLGVVAVNVSGRNFVGGLVGRNELGTITSCYATGTVIGTGAYIGGMVGYIEYGTIASCCATGEVSGSSYVGSLVGESDNRATITSCYATGTVIGTGAYIGGLVGGNGSGPITSCYATGPVRGNNKIGGLCGSNARGSITSCYATGLVSGISDIGGLLGFNEGGTITDSFWDMESSGQAYSAGGIGRTTAQMKTLSTFLDAGWDFVGETVNGTADIWRMPTGGYPILSWQPFVEPGVYFADLNLKSAVEAALGVTNPTAEDMLKLTSLSAKNKGITSLVGLETALNLGGLSLDTNNVSDITPLAGLTKLATLTLYSNKVTDVSPLAGLTKLYSLVLSANKVSDITPLAGLVNLAYLYINSNQISDFSALTGQTKLKEIYAARNAVLTKETYLAHIPAIRANNSKLAVFQYDPGCQAVMSGDVNQDCRVNLSDLAVIASNWLKCNHIYEEMCL